MDGSLAGIDWKHLGTMLRPAVQAEMAKLPQEVQAAFRATGAYITQNGSRIELEIRFTEGDEVASKVKDFVLNNLMNALPEVVKMVGARAFVKILKGGASGVS
jgi:hypothetical protein